LAATLARHAAAQGAVNDEDLLECLGAPPELQRRRGVNTRPVFGPQQNAFLQDYGPNFLLGLRLVCRT